MMIDVQNLTKRFSGRTAVNGISFQVQPGEIVGFLGPNGAGKSTTLKMITGMLQPTSGTVTVAGHDLATDPLAVKRSVGFVPESGALFESLTGLEYLRMVAALYGIPLGPWQIAFAAAYGVLIAMTTPVTTVSSAAQRKKKNTLGAM